MIYSFRNDYSEIAHKKVLERLMECSEEQNVGYGYDKHSIRAKELIKKALNYQDCDIHFLVGGTQTNLIAISAFLKPYEAVISCDSGHINVHETGAIEGTGHKVLVAESRQGKLTPEGIAKTVLSHQDEHQVLPKMVYLSQSTEMGTVYSKEELIDIRAVCDLYQLYLFVDGARLASGLMSSECDLTLQDMTTLTDAFYIGGTKNGCMIGEALILIHPHVKKNFRFLIKHKGGLLAKSFITAIGFEVLFEEQLFMEIGRHENEMAKLLSDELKKMKFEFLSESSTNQIFPIFSNALINKIKDDYLFEIWEKLDQNKSVIRLVTSFSTTSTNIYEFIEYIKRLIL